MAQPDPDKLAREMEALLQSEADALRQARFERLHEIVREKESLIGKGGFGDLGKDAALRIRTLSRRNEALLEGSMGGLKAAMNRIDALNAQPAELNTYDGSGRRMSLSCGVSRAPRRA